MEATNEFDNFRFTYRNIEQPQKNDFSKHMHHYYEILFFIAGDIRYVIEEKTYLLRPYDLLLIPSTKYHFANVVSPARYERYVIDFTPECTDPQLLDEVFSKGRFFHLEKGSEIERCFRDLKDCSENRNDYNELSCKTLLTEILLLLVRLEGLDPLGSENVTETTCSAVIEYISNNLSSITSLDEMAKHFFVSKSTLSHTFKEYMGISLMHYLRDKRLMLAQTLLGSGNKPTEIYEQCGFRDYATFYRAYVRYFGVNPSGRRTTLL